MNKRIIGFILAALTAACCLTSGGCAPAPVSPSDGAVSPADAEIVYENVPEEYRDLFHGGSFDENNIWTTDDESYFPLIEQLGDHCDKTLEGSLILATDEKVIFAGGWDSKEIDGETIVNPFTTYEIGSVTKQFCAVAILQQVQAGKIDVNDTIDRYFPDYPHGGKITVDNLLHMDSGIPEMLDPKFHDGDFRKNEAFMNGTMSDGELLDRLNGFALDFEPGSRFEYSNTNYWLLALILEQVSGQSYEDYLEENIFGVCDMPLSSACTAGDLTSAPQLGYKYMETRWCCRGAGDIHSNVCDMLRWNRTLFGGGLLDGQQMQYMTAKRSGYSCGWMDEQVDCLGHSGSTWGYVAYNGVFTTAEGENLYLVILSGNRGGAMYGVRGTLELVDKMVP